MVAGCAGDAVVILQPAGHRVCLTGVARGPLRQHAQQVFMPIGQVVGAFEEPMDGAAVGHAHIAKPSADCTSSTMKATKTRPSASMSIYRRPVFIDAFAECHYGLRSSVLHRQPFKEVPRIENAKANRI